MTPSLPYFHPIDQLLAYPMPRKAGRRPSYKELQIDQTHVPDLLRMGTDINLLWAEPESPASMAPVHAWRLLARLQAVEAIGPLVQLLKTPDISRFIESELPVVLSLFGMPAVPVLHAFLEERKHGEEPRSCAISVLSMIAETTAEARVACVDVLVDQVAAADRSDRIVNAYAVSALKNMKAMIALGAIESAYRNEAVDTAIAGDWSAAVSVLGHGRTAFAPLSGPRRGRPLGMPRLVREPGRNEPCPCGSGIKFKKCCRAKRLGA